MTSCPEESVELQQPVDNARPMAALEILSECYRHGRQVLFAI